MKEIIAWMALATLLCLGTACAAEPSASSLPTSVLAPQSANDRFGSQFLLSALLTNHIENNYVFPDITVSLKNSSDRSISFDYRGPSVFHFAIDYLCDGQNAEDTSGWTPLQPHTRIDQPDPKRSGVVGAGMFIMYQVKPGCNITREIYLTDFVMTNPGYYRIVIAMTLEKALSYAGINFSGKGRPESLQFQAPPLIIHRTATGFEAWTPPVEPKHGVPSAAN